MLIPASHSAAVPVAFEDCATPLTPFGGGEAGGVAEYAIRVINRGRSALRGLRIADRLPAGMSLVSVPSGARLRAGRLVWSLGMLGAGAALPPVTG